MAILPDPRRKRLWVWLYDHPGYRVLLLVALALAGWVLVLLVGLALLPRGR